MLKYQKGIMQHYMKMDVSDEQAMSLAKTDEPMAQDFIDADEDLGVWMRETLTRSDRSSPPRRRGHRKHQRNHHRRARGGVAARPSANTEGGTPAERRPAVIALLDAVDDASDAIDNFFISGL